MHGALVEGDKCVCKRQRVKWEVREGDRDRKRDSETETTKSGTRDEHIIIVDCIHVRCTVGNEYELFWMTEF